MLTLLLFTLSSATAQSTLFNETLQGGVSVATTGVAAIANDNTGSWTEAASLVLAMPTGATPREGYAIIHSSSGGFYQSDQGARTWLNTTTVGSDIASLGTLVASSTYTRVYKIPGTFFTESTIRYWERNDIELSTALTGTGTTGITLAVIYDDPTRYARNHVRVQTTHLNDPGLDNDITISGLPTSGTTGSMVFSATIPWECTTEQNNIIQINGSNIVGNAGGTDDGNVSCETTYHALITGGDFGYNDSGVAVGLDGDSPTSEPGGTSTNSRLSDELYTVAYPESGSFTLTMFGDGDSWMGNFVASIEMDADDDGVPDRSDPDIDNDGVANAADINPYNPFQCRDTDNDTCDDCSQGNDGFGTGHDYDPDDDGFDYDQDGDCDAHDTCVDSDGDNVGDAGHTSSGCALGGNDNCPTVQNGNQSDLDSDGVGDLCDDCTDPDSDGYGTPGLDLSGCSESDSVADNCPTVTNGDQSNLDSDAFGDLCDTCTDPDLDDYGTPGLDLSGCPGSTTLPDNCPTVQNGGQSDGDGDGDGDLCDTCTDPDDDGYGTPGLDLDGCTNSTTEADNCPTVQNGDQSDLDLDGDGDLCDTCTDPDSDDYGTPGLDLSGCTASTTLADNCPTVTNDTQSNLDNDSFGDLCDPCTDPDLDGWGTPGLDLLGCSASTTVADNCPTTTNPSQSNLDNDGFGDTCDACTDPDSDGWGNPGLAISGCAQSANVVDNCPATSNPDQADADDDNVGDLCDGCDDFDSDGFADPGSPRSACPEDGEDNCPDDSNTDQIDTDLDDQGDVCDLDDDEDGLTDEEEAALQTDPKLQDTDGDGISDWDEVGDPSDPANTDGDAEIDALDEDSDGDGLTDAEEAGDTDLGTLPVDTDEDGIPDFQDTDSDGDGVLDGDDNCPIVANDQADMDENGVGDACDGDIDGDGHDNDRDVCPTLSDADQDDRDSNGTGDACEEAVPYLAGGCTSDTTALGFGPWALVLLALRRRRAPAQRA